MRWVFAVAIIIVLVACGGESTDSPTATTDQSASVAATPTSTSVPEPTATATLAPEPTATSTVAPTATPTPAPTATPEPSPTPEPTATPEPEAVCPERGEDQWIYATDSFNHLVRVFDFTGVEVCSWGGLGSEPGLFDEPLGITTGIDGTVYVADQLNGRVQIFTGRGAYAGVWMSVHENSFATLVATSPSGDYLYVLDRRQGRLEIVEIASMNPVAELHLPQVITLARALTPWEGDTVALSLPGGLFIVEPSSDNVRLFAPADGVLPDASIRAGNGQSLLVLSIASSAVTMIAVMNEAGQTTDFLLDDNGTQIRLNFNDQIGLGVTNDGQLVVSERSSNAIAIFSIDDLPTASLVTLWQIEPGDLDIMIDLREIALSP